MEKLNLKCEGVRLWGDRQTMRRWRKTRDFMMKYRKINIDWLFDFGPESRFGRNIAKSLGLGYSYIGECDLNNSDWVDHTLKYPYIVLCSHVIEHVYNPNILLFAMKSIIPKDSQIFIMYPRTPRFLWNNTHFHEFSRKALLSLVDYSGYEVVAYETHRGWHNWYFYFTGFRPFIRFWCTVFNWHNNEYYLLRLKDD